MIRWLTIPALLVFSMLPAMVGATHSNGDGPRRDLVAGTLMLDTPQLQAQFHLNAKSDPDGNDPHGSFFLRQEPFVTGALDVRGSVTCLDVTGNRAWVGLVVEESTGTFPLPEGSGLIFEIVDNGEPGDADRAVGQLSPTPPRRCRVDFAEWEITRGNITVHDATP